jgi:hypothetical protein
MLLSESVLTAGQLIEVSGWDEDRVFFVERSLLSSDDFDGKQVSLSHMLSEGSIIFLCLLEQSSSHRPSAIPYEARFLGCDSRGQYRFRLQTVVLSHPNQPNPVN